jgi:putative transposase
MRRQCQLLGVSRSMLYYQPATESEYNLHLMRQIDEQYMQTPFYGSRRMTEHLKRLGYHVNRKRIQRLMRLMGIEAIYPKPKRSTINSEHRIYPYLLRDYEVTAANEVWSADITYIPMDKGFMYLVAILDWYSRYVITWELSNSLSGQFCLDALHHALSGATPIIFNTDQGVQFTANAFTDTVEADGIAMSMDSVGRAIDNIYIERFWRSVKYEDVYHKLYQTGQALFDGLTQYIRFYNQQRPHQSLNYATPAEVYLS